MADPFIKATRRAMRRVGDDMMLIDIEGIETPVKGIKDDPETFAIFESKYGKAHSDLTASESIVTLLSETGVEKGWRLRIANNLYRVAKKPLDDVCGLCHCYVQLDTQEPDSNVSSEYGQFN